MNNAKSYEPLWMGALTGLAVLILWYFSSLAIDKTVVPKAGTLLPFFTAGFGAFCGSYFAFMLRKHEEKQAKLNKRKAAFDACLFTLYRQNKAMTGILATFDQYPGRYDRAFTMPGMTLPEQEIKINFDDLNFLSELDEIELLLALTDVQYNYVIAVGHIELRANFFSEILGPAVQGKFIDGQPYTDEQMIEIMGSNVFHNAFGYADAAYNCLQQVLPYHLDIYRKTREVAKKTFPDKKFLGPSFTPTNTPESPQP